MAKVRRIPRDDMHPIVRESKLQEDEALKIIGRCGGAIPVVPELLKAEGITDPARIDAIIDVLSAATSGLFNGAQKRGGALTFDVIGFTIAQAVALGIRLKARGLV